MMIIIFWEMIIIEIFSDGDFTFHLILSVLTICFNIL
jgi:hypothetical protein